jgi:hypothetical protein
MPSPDGEEAQQVESKRQVKAEFHGSWKLELEVTEELNPQESLETQESGQVCWLTSGRRLEALLMGI